MESAVTYEGRECDDVMSPSNSRYYLINKAVFRKPKAGNEIISISLWT